MGKRRRAGEAKGHQALPAGVRNRRTRSQTGRLGSSGLSLCIRPPPWTVVVMRQTPSGRRGSGAAGTATGTTGVSSSSSSVEAVGVFRRRVGRTLCCGRGPLTVRVFAGGGHGV